MPQLAIVSLYITRAMMLDALDKVVSARGRNFTYTNYGQDGEVIDATYWDREQGCPSCGVGAALMILGVSVEVLQELDHANMKCPYSCPEGTGAAVGDEDFRRVLHQAGVHLEFDAELAANVFQEYQDTAVAYGRCWMLAEQAK